MKYKQYQKYKDSGIEWIGEIPEHWEVRRIRYCLESHKQGFYTEDEYIDDGVRLVRITDIDDFGNIDYQKMPLVKISANEELSFDVKPGDFLFARSGTIGRFGLAKNPERSVFASYLIRFRFKKFSNNFLKLVFLSNYFKESLISSLHGGANKNIHAENIKEIDIAFPISTQEQNLIYDNVSPNLDSIENIISKSKQQVNLLQEKRETLINHTVTKGLDPSVSMKDSGIEWIGEIPEHWEVMRLKFLCNITTGKKNTEDNELEGKFPFFVRSQIVEKISTYSCDEEAVLTAGDGVGVGKVFHYIDGKFDFHQRVYKMSSFKKILGKYFFHYLKENFKKEISKGTAKSTVDSLRLNMIQDFVVTFGNKEEQQQILEFLDVQTKQFDDLISKSKQQINFLQEKRQALITSAVTGKIDVRNGIA